MVKPFHGSNRPISYFCTEYWGYGFPARASQTSSGRARELDCVGTHRVAVHTIWMPPSNSKAMPVTALLSSRKNTPWMTSSVIASRRVGVFAVIVSTTGLGPCASARFQIGESGTRPGGVQLTRIGRSPLPMVLVMPTMPPLTPEIMVDPAQGLVLAPADNKPT